MCHLIADSLLASAASGYSHLRLVGMLLVLVGGLTSGYLASSRFGISENLAKKIMTAVLIFLNWPIALLVIWRMNLDLRLIWLPIVGLILMLTITIISTVLFLSLKLERKSQLTLILAGSLSNLGYTGGAFVCYALFGAEALALANIYLLLWLPTAYLIFFPLLKIIQFRSRPSGSILKHTLDLRCLVLPAVITAIVLNLTDIKTPAFVTRFHIVDILVYAASSLSFFAIGLRVNFSRLKNYINLYFPLVGVKFILTPAVALLLIWLLTLTGNNLPDMVRKVIIVLSATPSAVLMVTMSNVFDLDGPLASALWLVTTAVFAVVVVPVLFFAFA